MAGEIEYYQAQADGRRPALNVTNTKLCIVSEEKAGIIL